jgi:hypothetical protein
MIRSPDRRLFLTKGCQTEGCPWKLLSPSETGYLRGENPCQADPPKSPHFYLLLPLPEGILCLFCKKPCPCFRNRSFHSLLGIFSSKLNPEICLFRRFWEAEKRVPRGIAWGRGKEGLFWGAGYDRQEIPLTPAPHHNSLYQDDRSQWGIQEGGCLGLMLHRGRRGCLSLGC